MTYQVALQVAQEAILVLAKWVNANNLPSEYQPSKNLHQAVIRARKILSWHNNLKPSHLRLLFDDVKLRDQKSQDKQHYCPAQAIADSDPVIPYPLQQAPDLSEYKKSIKVALEDFKNEDWQNLSLLILIIEKYGSCLSFGESNVALIDMVRSTAAVATAIAHNPQAEQISLVAGDLSGIQDFIYTISADGALKSLRARSFYLELVTEEVVQQVLATLELPRTSIVYAGGGNLYLLAPDVNIENKIQELQNKLNHWLKNTFQSKIFLALTSHNFNIVDVKSKILAGRWNEAIIKLNQQKSQKFNTQILDLLKPQISYEQKCRVCHRDDVLEKDLKPLHNQEQDAVLACPTCRDMFELGGHLLRVKAIIRSSQEQIKGAEHTISFELPTGNIYYHLFSKWKQIIKDADTALLVNDWTIEHYGFRHFSKAIPLLVGNYTVESKKELGKIMRAEELTEAARGIKRVGYLRMDVDNLGKIFAKGLAEKYFLPRLAGLSRQMSYFFKVYLNSLASDRQKNFIQPLNDAKYLTTSERPHLVFIYAGGDDLFVSGAWNEVIEFAGDVYQSFRAYTGYNPDITLSGGISINDIKYPLYQAANESGEAGEAAKRNNRDSLGLFGEVFKWDEWLGKIQIKDEAKESDIIKYLASESLPKLLGILPFVKKLYTVDTNYSRSFVRNLLATAQIQTQMIKEIEEKQQYKDQDKDIRYYLHLPKIAYTLARLPKRVLDDDDFRTSLKSPWNAPYFRAIATWIELLTRNESHDSNND